MDAPGSGSPRGRDITPRAGQASLRGCRDTAQREDGDADAGAAMDLAQADLWRKGPSTQFSGLTRRSRSPEGGPPQAAWKPTLS
ncbi:hypothetical protein AcV5_004676 [Taiwanofungus camphoratus]|nr:hypothetical protein AcV5_004676 [Antrodia cinnamomea]